MNTPFFLGINCKILTATIKNTGKGDVSFDNFVQACVTMKTLTDSFRQFDNDQDGWIQINYEQVSFYCVVEKDV